MKNSSLLDYKQTWRIMEAATHAFIGFMIGFLVVGILHLLGVIQVNWEQNFYISFVITALNMFKSYILRCWFHIKRKEYNEESR